MKELNRGTICFATWRANELLPATVISHHPEVGAIKVKVLGEEWTLHEHEVLRVGSSGKAWPEWLRTFVAAVKATKSKHSDTKPNKAEAARALKMDYALLLRLCKRVEAMGVTLMPSSLSQEATPRATDGPH